MPDGRLKPRGPRWTDRLSDRWAKRIAVTLIGFSVLAVGIAMVVLPGPALVVIPAGLAILGTEYAWARAWLLRAKAKGAELAHAAANGLKREGEPPRH